jgi:hypothetical protein
MRKTAFLARIETLERRETPSTATTHHLVALTGSGVGQVDAPPTVNGTTTGLTFTLSGSGSAGPIHSTYTGHGGGTITKNGNAGGSAVVFLANGDRVDVAFRGTARVSKLHPEIVSASLNFKIVDVGGQFSGDAGSGKVTGTLDTATGALSYTFRGQVRV